VNILSEKNDIRIDVCDSDYTAPHTHDFIEFTYVLEGKASHIINDKKGVIKKGDYFFMDYGAYHSYKRISKEKFCVVNCIFKPRFIDKSLAYCRSFSEILNNWLIKFKLNMLSQNPINIVFKDGGLILPYIEKMVDEYEKKSPGYREIIRCNLIEAIIVTVRDITVDEFPDEGMIKKIIEEINERYTENITLSYFAEKYSYSIPHLSKKFKEEVGVGFTEYLQMVRIEQSCHHLLSGDVNISHVAEMSGYGDVKFFTQIFKRYKGVSPGRFRRQQVEEGGTAMEKKQ